MAKIFLHALSISKKYNIIAFLSLKGSEENGVDGQLFMPLRHSLGPTGVSWLSKWQAIKAFHIGMNTCKKAICFFFSSLFT